MELNRQTKNEGVNPKGFLEMHFTVYALGKSDGDRWTRNDKKNVTVLTPKDIWKSKLRVLYKRNFRTTDGIEFCIIETEGTEVANH